MPHPEAAHGGPRVTSQTTAETFLPELRAPHCARLAQLTSTFLTVSRRRLPRRASLRVVRA